jgi:methylmalonyl-CoA mutase cobalamin-binding subunit
MLVGSVRRLEVEEVRVRSAVMQEVAVEVQQAMSDRMHYVLRLLQAMGHDRSVEAVVQALRELGRTCMDRIRHHRLARSMAEARKEVEVESIVLVPGAPVKVVEEALAVFQ